MPTLAEFVEPRFRTEPTYEWTEGALVAALLAGCWDDKGPFELDPEQQLVVDAAFAYVKTGPEERLAPWVTQLQPVPRLASFEICVVAPRQNMKTGALKAIALGKIFISRQRLVIWTSHKGSSAQEAYRDLKMLIESDPDLLAEVVPGGFHAAANNLSIEFTDDRRIIFATRTADSAQSFTGDTVIIDEAYKLEPDFIASLTPTLSARPEPQIVYGSSAGHLKSAALRTLRDRGRAGDHRLAYFEWSATPRACAEPDCDHSIGMPGCFLDDEDAWLECNTAVFRGRITLDTLRGLRRAMASDPMKFARECMALWDDPGEDTGPRPIEADRFSKLVAALKFGDVEPVFSLDVSPRRTWAAIVAAGEVDGRVLVEIPSRKRVKAYARGTTWVVPTFRRMRKRFDGATVRILAKSQAAPFAPKLIELGFEVELVAMGDYPPMCAGLAQMVDDGVLAHHGEQELLEALGAAAAVEIGEEQWRWGRRKSGGDITPLVAMTLAADGANGDGGHGLGIW